MIPLHHHQATYLNYSGQWRHRHAQGRTRYHAPGQDAYTPETTTVIRYQPPLHLTPSWNIATETAKRTHKNALNHLMMQGRIKRFHRSMKNVVKHEHYYFPSELGKTITEWSNAAMSAFTNHRIRSHRRMHTTGEETIIRIWVPSLNLGGYHKKVTGNSSGICYTGVSN